MTANGEWHNINQLYGAPPGGSGGKAKSLHTSAGRGRYGLINGMVVYDHWYTTLSAQDSFYIKGAGGRVEDYITVESYGEDWFKTPRHEMEYTLSMDEIPENIDDYEKTHYITITQVATGITITVVCTQGPAEWSVDYTLAMYPTTLPASGGYTYGTVYRWVYRNDKLYDYLTLNPTSMNGFAVNGSGHSIGSNWLYINSAGTEYYTYTRTVYAITSYSFVYAGETITLDTHVSINQEPNYRTTTERYSVSMDAPSESVIQHIGGTFTVKAYCEKAIAYEYSSGSIEVIGDWTDSLANVLYSSYINSISPTQFIGETTITVNVPENTSSLSRKINIGVRSAHDTDVYTEKTITQNGAANVTITIYAKKSKVTNDIGMMENVVQVEVYVTNNSGPSVFKNNHIQIRNANNTFYDILEVGEISKKIGDFSVPNDGNQHLVHSFAYTVTDEDVYNNCRVWVSLESATYKSFVDPMIEVPDV